IVRSLQTRSSASVPPGVQGGTEARVSDGSCGYRFSGITGRTRRPNVAFVTAANDAYQAAIAVASPTQPPALTSESLAFALPMTRKPYVTASRMNTSA